MALEAKEPTLLSTNERSRPPKRNSVDATEQQVCGGVDNRGFVEQESDHGYVGNAISRCVSAVTDAGDCHPGGCVTPLKRRSALRRGQRSAPHPRRAGSTRCSSESVEGLHGEPPSSSSASSCPVANSSASNIRLALNEWPVQRSIGPTSDIGEETRFVGDFGSVPDCDELGRLHWAKRTEGRKQQRPVPDDALSSSESNVGLSTGRSGFEASIVQSRKKRHVVRIGIFYSDVDQCEVAANVDTTNHHPRSTAGRYGATDGRVSAQEKERRKGQYASTKARAPQANEMPHNGAMTRGSPSSERRRPSGSFDPVIDPDGGDRRVGGGGGRFPPSLWNDRRPAMGSTQILNGYTHVDPVPPPDLLPDILNSHLPPPYSARPTDGVRRAPAPLPPLPPHPPPGCGPSMTPYPHAASSPRRSVRGSRSGGLRSFQSRARVDRGSVRGGSMGHASSETEEPKHCCGVMVTQTISIRWFIVMIAFVGLCCSVVGTVLGALRSTGREHLTVSLLMIGVGIVLITVSGIAWRLTAHDAPSWRAMLGLQTDIQEPNRRFVPRVPPYGRPQHPYAAMLYPEFQYRPPPPSYQASMQEYRLRLLLLDRQQGAVSTSLSPVSPPPTYRSHGSGTLHSRPPLSFMERDYSRPPSYRSHASSGGALRPSIDTLDSHPPEGVPITAELATTPGSPSQSVTHSRNPSLSLSFLSHESLFDPAHASSREMAARFTSPSGERTSSVVGGLSDESPLAGGAPPVGSVGSSGSSSIAALRKVHDVNTVTIVQTTDSSQVLNQDTVIVSVQGQCPRVLQTPSSGGSAGSPGEVQILAHV